MPSAPVKAGGMSFLAPFVIARIPFVIARIPFVITRIPFVITRLDPLLSGLIIWTRCMILILLGFKRLSAFETRNGDQYHAA